MKILTMTQTSDAWFAARQGRPTASGAAKILTSTGKASAQRKNYLFEKVAERAGCDAPRFEPTEAMIEGVRREEESRDAYAFLTGHIVEEVGMLICDATGASASPDGWIEGSHGLELKNPKPSTFFAEMYAGKVPTKYIPQIHFSLAVSGLDRWDYGCYLPGQSLLIHTLERNSYTETMEQAIADFVGELENICERLEIKTEVYK